MLDCPTTYRGLCGFCYDRAEFPTQIVDVFCRSEDDAEYQEDPLVEEMEFRFWRWWYNYKMWVRREIAKQEKAQSQAQLSLTSKKSLVRKLTPEAAANHPPTPCPRDTVVKNKSASYASRVKETA